ncbi:hypothetical protein GPALN_010744 [Globodera pallida]|nr:hypothetical protein GPALN_010744 [Globodera pallida]
MYRTRTNVMRKKPRISPFFLLFLLIFLSFCFLSLLLSFISPFSYLFTYLASFPFSFCLPFPPFFLFLLFFVFRFLRSLFSTSFWVFHPTPFCLPFPRSLFHLLFVFRFLRSLFSFLLLSSVSSFLSILSTLFLCVVSPPLAHSLITAGGVAAKLCSNFARLFVYPPTCCVLVRALAHGVRKKKKHFFHALFVSPPPPTNAKCWGLLAEGSRRKW